MVLVLERVPASLRGELSRWMIEPKAGVFVGKVSALVRDKLWEKMATSLGQGGAVLIHTSNTEQGFAVRTWGDTTREMVEVDGLRLVMIRSDEGAVWRAAEAEQADKQPGASGEG